MGINARYSVKPIKTGRKKRMEDPQVYKCVNCFNSYEHVNKWALCRQCERKIQERDTEQQTER